MTEKKYVKLPNEQIFEVSKQGSIHAYVEVDLEDLVRQTREELLAQLSSQAFGELGPAAYAYFVVGHVGGNTLELDVESSILDGGFKEINYDDLPELEFDVLVTRISYGSRTYRLSAKTLSDAIDIAGDDAGDHLYREESSDYTVEAFAVDVPESAADAPV